MDKMTPEEANLKQAAWEIIQKAFGNHEQPVDLGDLSDKLYELRLQRCSVDLEPPDWLEPPLDLRENSEYKYSMNATVPAVETNAQGGKQAASPYFFRGLPPLALRRIAHILRQGAEKYEADPFGNIQDRNWHRITSDEHLEHVLAHAVSLLVGDASEDHAGNLATRALFFLHQRILENPEA